VLHLDQRASGIWRIRGTVHGVTVNESARTRSKSEARLILKARAAQIFGQVYGITPAGKPLPPPPDEDPTTFADAAISWMSAGGNSTTYHYFPSVLQALADMPLADITNGTLRRTADQLFTTQAATTVNRHFFTLVSAILNHAAEERMMVPFKVRKAKTVKAAFEWYEPERIETVLAAAGDLEPMLTFFVATGARPSEVTTLTWGQVGRDNKRVVLWKTKGGRVRSYDMGRRGRAVMPERRGADDFVFLNGNGQPYARSPDGRFYGPRQRVDRMTKRTGIPPISLRALRHTWATWQYSLEPDLFKLQANGGWSTVAMVENYTHVASPDIAKRVKAHGWADE